MEREKTKSNFNDKIPFLVLAAVVAIFYVYGHGQTTIDKSAETSGNAKLIEMMTPVEGSVLPVVWGDLGKQMLAAGVIDEKKLTDLYEQRGGLDEETKKLVYGENNGALQLHQPNATIILNLLWALGLANKNDILENGPMKDSQYGGAENFASTAGWTLSRDEAMTYYSHYQFVILTPEQQALVERVSKNIYRPCCDNSTYFPDCNHGMAMLGLLELMASQGTDEETIYKTALTVSAYWFPDNYTTIAKYLAKRGTVWGDLSPKEILGKKFSGLSGYLDVVSKLGPFERGDSSSCGI